MSLILNLEKVHHLEDVHGSVLGDDDLAGVDELDDDHEKILVDMVHTDVALARLHEPGRLEHGPEVWRIQGEDQFVTRERNILGGQDHISQELVFSVLF